MSRLENAVRPRDLLQMGRYLLDTFVASYASALGVIIIDCDDTNNTPAGTAAYFVQQLLPWPLLYASAYLRRPVGKTDYHHFETRAQEQAKQRGITTQKK